MTLRNYRRCRRIMLVLAAAPLFQLGACQTGFNQTGAFVLNNLPSTLFPIVQSAFLAPFFAILNGGTGTTGLGGGGI